ncbi:paraquat-inducible protein A [Polycyclovorans algicola]|uniref:paraquat-inducible protein A n=1 Tax=Polycyclovorans algicola TaxID=616992 RepID=UPI0005BCF62F|nr:paraquat-inducible protein A [Polycyclovorans algicola]
MNALSPTPRTLVVCPHCDAVHRIVAVRSGKRVSCQRCGCALYEQTRLPLQSLLAGTVAALLFFAIANLTPLLTFELAGERRLAPLWAGVAAVWEAGEPMMAVIAGMTTLVFPLLTLSLLLYALLPLSLGTTPQGYRSALHALRWLRPWSLLEVFFLGVLVSLVKLTDVATVILGPGLFAVVVLSLLMVRLGSFDMALLWDHAPPVAQ